MSSPYQIDARPEAFRSDGHGVDFAGDDSVGFVPVVIGLVAALPALFTGIGKAIDAGKARHAERAAAGTLPTPAAKRTKRKPVITPEALAALNAFASSVSAQPGQLAVASPSTALKGDSMEDLIMGADGGLYQVVGDDYGMDLDLPFDLPPEAQDIASLLLTGGASLPALLAKRGGGGHRRGGFNPPGPRGGPGAGHPGNRGGLPPQLVELLRKALTGQPHHKQAALQLINSIKGDDMYGDDISGEEIGAELAADPRAELRTLILRARARRALQPPRGAVERGPVVGVHGIGQQPGYTASINMFNGSATNNRNVFTIPGGGTATAILLTSESLPATKYQIKGFVTKVGSSDNSQAMVEDFHVSQDSNIFLGDLASDATQYQTDMSNLVGLRKNPRVWAPMSAFVTAFAVGNANGVVTLTATIIGNVYEDSAVDGLRARLNQV